MAKWKQLADALENARLDNHDPSPLTLTIVYRSDELQKIVIAAKLAGVPYYDYVARAALAQAYIDLGRDMIADQGHERAVDRE